MRLIWHKAPWAVFQKVIQTSETKSRGLVQRWSLLSLVERLIVTICTFLCLIVNIDTQTSITLHIYLGAAMTVSDKLLLEETFLCIWNVDWFSLKAYIHLNSCLFLSPCLSLLTFMWVTCSKGSPHTGWILYGWKCRASPRCAVKFLHESWKYLYRWL